MRYRREGDDIVMLNPNRTDRHFGSFRFNQRTLFWKDFATGDRGRGVESLLDFLQIPRAEWSASFLYEARTPVCRLDRMLLARSIWEHAKPAKGTLVEAYLRSRGISEPAPPSLKYVASLRYDAEQNLPGMIAAVTSADGELVAVHRTYLCGASKAKVPSVRKLLGSPRGGAVHLGKVKDSVAITEGIETGLSLQLATTFRLGPHFRRPI